MDSVAEIELTCSDPLRSAAMPTRLSARRQPSFLRRPDVGFGLFIGALLIVGLLARAVGLLPLQ